MADGVKFDGDKPRMDLVPWGPVREFAKVLTYGAGKYPEADNWKRVPEARARYFAAAMRHLTAWWDGELKDGETGLSHLAHAGCCVMFLLWAELRGEVARPALKVTPIGEENARAILHAIERPIAPLPPPGVRL